MPGGPENLVVVYIRLCAKHPKWCPYYIRIYYCIRPRLLTAPYYYSRYSDWRFGNSLAAPSVHPLLQDQ